MAQQTQLTVYGVPGRTQSFVAKAAAPVAGDSDTYFFVSSLNPDILDLYVEGSLIHRWEG